MRVSATHSTGLALAMALILGCVPQSRLRTAQTPPPADVVVRTMPAAPAMPAPVPRPDLASRLAMLAPDADPQVLSLAVQARQCAASRGEAADARRLAVIDYSRPSTETRLWVFDVASEALLYSEVVAHGRNTGGNLAARFSNDDGSYQSSLGLFRTAETYVGGNGYSLRMDGLEPGVNDRARDRAIVMHGAWYVDPVAAKQQGRLGRSLGCPALRPQIARGLIDSIKDGQLLFAYYPDQAWLKRSRYFGCGEGVAREDEPKPRGGGSLHATAR